MDKVVTSALCLIPDEKEWPQIQAIRAKYDKAYKRWMPHINLLYPFIPDKDFAAALPKLQQALSNVNPFTLEFNSFSYFQHGSGNCTVFLEPTTDPPTALEDLQMLLEKTFPHCTDLRERGDGHFHGHLTVGQFMGKQKAEAQIQTFMKTFKPISIKVTRVALISRRGTNPFEVRHYVDFGGSPKTQDYTPPSVANNTVENIDNTPPSQPNTADWTNNTSNNDLPTNKVDQNYKPSEVHTTEDPLGIVFQRVQQWINKTPADKRPKTKQKLSSSIAPLCRVKCKPITVEEVMRKFKQENLISVDANGQVSYLQKSDSPVIVRPRDPYLWAKDLKRDAFDKCDAWIRHPNNQPKTEQALRRSLEQLVEVTDTVDTHEVIDKLLELRLIEFDNYDNITYL